MMRIFPLILASAAGAGLGLLLDPVSGHRRQTRIRDKALHLWKLTKRTTDVTSRDVMNRTRGLIAERRSTFSHEEVDDDVLTRRVAARLGHVVSHPRTIGITVQSGRVTLLGPILKSEIRNLLEAVKAVPGVIEIDNQLEEHENSDDIPALQAQGHPPYHRFNFSQTNWTPTTRLIALGMSGSLLSYGLRNRSGGLGSIGSILGLGLATRAVTNLPFQRLLGIGAGYRAVDVQKTITIRAPLQRVFDYWANFANFPSFMENIADVQDLGNGRSRWVVRGPFGISLEWNAVLTKLESGRMIAWQSEVGAAIQCAGVVTFIANGDDSTTVQIRLSYNPPAGALGHALATVLGVSPKQKMDTDLVRVKTFLETGIAPRLAARRRVS